MLHFPRRGNRVAVAGILAVGAAIAFSSVGIVRAELSASKSKLFACSSGAACVEGSSTGTSTAGVFGTASIADGVHGVTAGAGSSGVSGISVGSAGTAHGVYGRSSNGQGVYGTSSSNNGVEGHSTAANGNGVSGYGLQAGSGNGTGVYGSGYFGVWGEASYAGVVSQADGLYSYIFQGFNTASNGQCFMDWEANLTCSGTITGGYGYRVRQANSDGQRVLAYAPESASATMEDVGTGYMVGGVATVAIDRAFASTIERSQYHVFVTPDGDASLYVAQKAPAGFVVRELHGGRSTLSFDYRIVARPIDAKADRLPLAPDLPRPPRFARTRH